MLSHSHLAKAPRQAESEDVPAALPERRPEQPEKGWVVYARFSTFNAQTSAIDAGIAYVRDEVMTSMQHIEGFIGLSMLVNRTTGLCIATSAWRDEATMLASADRASQLRARGSEILGSPAGVEEYEIALMHRAHRATSGAHVRGNWCHGDAASLDSMIDSFRMATLPAIEDLQGFGSASVYMNRTTGRCCVSVAYDSAADLEANRADANDLRMRTMTELGLTLDEVCEFELAFARLHVPELV